MRLISLRNAGDYISEIKQIVLDNVLHISIFYDRKKLTSLCLLQGIELIILVLSSIVENIYKLKLRRN